MWHAARVTGDLWELSRDPSSGSSIEFVHLLSYWWIESPSLKNTPGDDNS